MYEKLPKNDKNQIIIPKEFKRITQNELIFGDILLMYNGNKLTELHGKHRMAKYGRADTVPYHSAIFFEQPKWILDQELTGSFSILDEYLSKKDTRIDIIRYPIDDYEAKVGISVCENLGKIEGRYDGRGYMFYLSQFYGFQWVGNFVKPSESKFYCSDMVAYIFERMGKVVSPFDHDHTAPVDLLLWAMLMQLEKQSVPICIFNDSDNVEISKVERSLFGNILFTLKLGV